VCPYHQWAYQLDGSLKRAPGMPDKEYFDYKDWGLHKVAVDAWAGLLFMWLGKEEPPTLIAKLGEPNADVMKLEPTRMRVAFKETLTFEANWKLLLENYLECYHCAGAHPELGIAMDLKTMYAGTDSWQSEYFHGVLPLKQGLSTISRDGHLVCTPLGLFRTADVIPSGFGAGFGIVPTLTRVIFHVDHAVVHSMNPLNKEKVQWETRWYVREDAVEGQDYDLIKLTEVWRATNLEDKSLCEHAYIGVKSRRFVPGPLNPKSESAIPSALNVYLAMMGESVPHA
jgi:Rieske 2Fe-2S family protein